MNSLVYFYSKFTEEFLLLGAAGVFTLLSIYCYHWVIQKRRLGVARAQIPSTVVKSYLNQLINEAEFVRKQLFGMTDGPSAYAPTGNFSTGATFTAPSAEGNQSISPDLLARVNALEVQLKEKEGLVVNINIEKLKLLDEIERLKAGGATAAPASANPAAQEQLAQKIKNLEARLEEYALFEEDLANLKRLQQENTQLKKKLTDLGTNPDTAINIPASASAPFEKKTLSAVPDLKPEAAAPETPKDEPKHALDPEAIENLLNGTPATPPESSPEAQAAAAADAAAEVAAANMPSMDELISGNPAEAKAAATPAAEPSPEVTPPAAAAAPTDQFEKLVDSVENSLEIPAVPEPATAAAAPKPAAQAAAPANSTPSPESAALANKTDEELLKEFENLLNS